MTTKGEKVFSISIFALTCIIIMIVCINIPTNNFNDNGKYRMEEYYVSSGESAWNIYKKTCPNSDWNDWCDFVRESNNITSLSKIYPGDILIVPIPID